MLGRPLQGIGLASVGAAQGPVPLLHRQGTARLELELGSQPLEALPATEVGVLPSRACRSLPYPGAVYVPINPWQVERKRHTLKVHVTAHAECGLLTPDGVCRGWSTSHDTSTGVGLSEGCSVTRLTES